MPLNPDLINQKIELIWAAVTSVEGATSDQQLDFTVRMAQVETGIKTPDRLTAVLLRNGIELPLKEVERRIRPVRRLGADEVIFQAFGQALALRKKQQIEEDAQLNGTPRSERLAAVYSPPEPNLDQRSEPATITDLFPLERFPHLEGELRQLAQMTDIPPLAARTIMIAYCFNRNRFGRSQTEALESTARSLKMSVDEVTQDLLAFRPGQPQTQGLLDGWRRLDERIFWGEEIHIKMGKNGAKLVRSSQGPVVEPTYIWPRNDQKALPEVKKRGRPKNGS